MHQQEVEDKIWLVSINLNTGLLVSLSQRITMYRCIRVTKSSVNCCMFALARNSLLLTNAVFVWRIISMSKSVSIIKVTKTNVVKFIFPFFCSYVKHICFVLPPLRVHFISLYAAFIKLKICVIPYLLTNFKKGFYIIPSKAFS